MFQTASTIREKAVLAIREMVQNGETCCSIPVGAGGGKLHVSADRNRVSHGFDVMQVDGVMYFIGLRKQ